MRLVVAAAACSLLLIGQAMAAPLPLAPPPDDPGATLVARSGSRAFSRCMRKRYGPHYYRGVKRAHRYFMAQACGG